MLPNAWMLGWFFGTEPLLSSCCAADPPARLVFAPEPRHDHSAGTVRARMALSLDSELVLRSITVPWRFS